MCVAEGSIHAQRAEGDELHQVAAADWLTCLVACREEERRAKVEEARRETERILAEQEAEVARRKVGSSAAVLAGLLAGRLKLAGQ